MWRRLSARCLTNDPSGPIILNIYQDLKETLWIEPTVTADRFLRHTLVTTFNSHLSLDHQDRLTLTDTSEESGQTFKVCVCESKGGTVEPVHVAQPIHCSKGW